jgi:hypothetical protein
MKLLLVGLLMLLSAGQITAITIENKAPEEIIAHTPTDDIRINPRDSKDFKINSSFIDLQYANSRRSFQLLDNLRDDYHIIVECGKFGGNCIARIK